MPIIDWSPWPSYPSSRCNFCLRTDCTGWCRHGAAHDYISVTFKDVTKEVTMPDDIKKKYRQLLIRLLRLSALDATDAEFVALQDEAAKLLEEG